jgi:hypothetical protein
MEVPADSCKAGTMGVVFLLLLVPDHQTITVKIENLDTISATVEEEEEVAGQEVLAEGVHSRFCGGAGGYDGLESEPS